MKRPFNESLEIGRVWEDKFLSILNKRLPKNIGVVDNRNTWRDNRDRKVPDFTLLNAKDGRRVYYDAKSKSYYKGNGKNLFTMDSSFVDSYRSLAEETGDKIYIAFWDKKKDPDNFYVLDVTQPEFDIYMYQNEYNVKNRASYRWDIETLIKRPIE